ncbi:glycosyltransferase [Candidatus Roizmanbacteria bacterium]|nr:glycosyltransferase [Candidatus Roizmanbacteria bacterium]
MKILFVNLSDYLIPPPTNVIRADTYISVPLAEELQNRGYEVYFLCPPGSTVRTKKIFSTHQPLSAVMPLNEIMQKSNIAREVELTFWFDIYFTLIEAVKMQHFDLIHFHSNTPLSELTALSKITTPCVFTLHSYPQFPDVYSQFFHFFNTRKNNFFVSISDFQQKKFPSTSFIGTVHNGLDQSNFSFDVNGGSKFLFAGRIVKEKGVFDAMMSCIKTNRKLIMTGSVDPSTLRVNEKDYYTSEIAPIISQNTHLIQFDDVTERTKMFSFYQEGRATLVPVLWDEPFGLVMIESMASGTPIIAYAKGSVPEIVLDGKTGFIVNSSDNDVRGDWTIKKTGIEGLCEAIERMSNMSDQDYKQMRRSCLAHVEKHFTLSKMTEQYEQIYKKILDLKSTN